MTEGLAERHPSSLRERVEACRADASMAIVDEPLACAAIPARVAAEERGRNRALLFTRLTDAPVPVVGNLYGASERLCRALGVSDRGELCERIERALDRPAQIGSPAPAEQCAMIPNPDLARHLPSIRYSSGDTEPYLTGGIVIARDPQSARHHLCYVRLAMLGGNRLLFNPATPRIRRIVDRTVGRGEPLDVAVAIGAPAALTVLACVTVPGEVDKLQAAQALAGGTLGFADGLLPVPAAADFVLTGQVVPRFRAEGRFGDLKGVYAANAANPELHVTSLRVRREPLFHSVSAGTSREHVELVTLGPQLLLERLRRAVPGILRCAIPAFGGGRLAVLTVAAGFDPRSVADPLAGVPIVRTFVFVNADVADDAAADLIWALVQRTPDAGRFRLAARAHEVFQERKLFIDATVSDPCDWANRRVRVFNE